MNQSEIAYGAKDAKYTTVARRGKTCNRALCQTSRKRRVKMAFSFAPEWLVKTERVFF